MFDKFLLAWELSSKWRTVDGKTLVLPFSAVVQHLTARTAEVAVHHCSRQDRHSLSTVQCRFRPHNRNRGRSAAVFAACVTKRRKYTRRRCKKKKVWRAAARQQRTRTVRPSIVSRERGPAARFLRDCPRCPCAHRQPTIGKAPAASRNERILYTNTVVFITRKQQRRPSKCRSSKKNKTGRRSPSRCKVTLRSEENPSASFVLASCMRM